MQCIVPNIYQYYIWLFKLPVDANAVQVCEGLGVLVKDNTST